MKRVLIILLVLVLGSCAALNLGKKAEPFAAGSESERRLAPGPRLVVSREETFIDTTRPTQANGRYAGEDKRTLKGRVWHPSNNISGPYPLIVYSHGFSSFHVNGRYIGEHLASLGYVVVAVDYPLTHLNAPGGPLVKDVLNQPADVSFLIDTLIAQSNTAGHVMEGMVDPSRIGVTGISLGGMTTTLAAFHPEMRDPRIGAALSIAGPTATFTATFFTHADVPFLMLAGDIDAMVPYASNAAPVPELVPGGQLVTLAGASHTGFAGMADSLRWLNNPDAIGCYMIKEDIAREIEEDDLWIDELGSAEQGINVDAVNELCLMDPLPEAMDVRRQHMITTVVVSSFFQSQFAPVAAQRRAAADYLNGTLAGELADVSYEGPRGNAVHLRERRQ
jgi:dienelactone hydrolase